MAYPIFVSPPSSKARFSDAIKYVEYNGREPAKCKYIENKNPFILKCLASGPDDKILDKLMIVKFNDSSEEEIKEILLNKGIECEGRRYYFLGHSDEQLKNKTCYVMFSNQEGIQALHSQLTDFSRRISVADRASEIGALFSDCRFSLELKEKEFKFTNTPDLELNETEFEFTSTLDLELEETEFEFTNTSDLESEEMEFEFTNTPDLELEEMEFEFTNTPDHCDNTEICGLMSKEFSQQIQKHGNLAHAPSAIRIIHENCNGWLLRNDSLKAPIKVRIHNSNVMFRSVLPKPKSGQPLRNKLGVLDIVKPYSLGYLDAQTVLLLAGKGVLDSYMEAPQKKYYDILDRLEEDRTHALFFLNMTGNKDLHGKVQEAGLTEEIKAQLKVIKEEEIRKMSSSQSSLRVLVPHSRADVFGFSDIYSQLRNGECFFDPTLPDGCPEQVEFRNANKVLVIPSPCYNPEEVCVLNLAKDISKYPNLKDCLVFPTESYFSRKNPGNQSKTYFVTWNPTLIPPRPSWSFKNVRTWLSRHPRMLTSTRQLKTKSSPKRRLSLLSPFKRPDSPKDSTQKERSGRQDLVEYFSSFKNTYDLLYRAEEIYKKFALLKGPSCKECYQLEAILSGGTNLTKERKKAEKIIAQVEKSCEGPDSGEKPNEKEEEGAVGMAHKEQSIRVVERMEGNAREYIAKCRLNTRDVAAAQRLDISSITPDQTRPDPARPDLNKAGSVSLLGSRYNRRDKTRKTGPDDG